MVGPALAGLGPTGPNTARADLTQIGRRRGGTPHLTPAYTATFRRINPNVILRRYNTGLYANRGRMGAHLGWVFFNIYTPISRLSKLGRRMRPRRAAPMRLASAPYTMSASTAGFGFKGVQLVGISEFWALYLPNTRRWRRIYPAFQTGHGAFAVLAALRIPNSAPPFPTGPNTVYNVQCEIGTE